jgi:hypothetical protein
MGSWDYRIDEGIKLAAAAKGQDMQGALNAQTGRYDAFRQLPQKRVL